MTLSCSSPVTVNESDNVTCVCRGKSGNPPANVTWYKDGIQIGGTGKEKQTLTLRNVNRADSGTYKCVAQSHINATDEKSIKVIVIFNCKYMIDTQVKLFKERINRSKYGRTSPYGHSVITVTSSIIQPTYFCPRKTPRQ